MQGGALVFSRRTKWLHRFSHFAHQVALGLTARSWSAPTHTRGNKLPTPSHPMRPQTHRSCATCSGWSPLSASRRARSASCTPCTRTRHALPCALQGGAHVSATQLRSSKEWRNAQIILAAHCPFNMCVVVFSCLQRRETPELRAHLEFLKKLDCYAGTYGCMLLEAVHAVRCTMVLGSWCAHAGCITCLHNTC